MSRSDDSSIRPTSKEGVVTHNQSTLPASRLKSPLTLGFNTLQHHEGKKSQVEAARGTIVSQEE